MILYKLETYTDKNGREKLKANRVGNHTFYNAVCNDGTKSEVTLQWVRENTNIIVNAQVNGRRLFCVYNKHQKAISTIKEDMFNRILYGDGIHPIYEVNHIKYKDDLKGNLKPEQMLEWAWGELVREKAGDLQALYSSFLAETIVRLRSYGYDVYLDETAKRKRDIPTIRVITKEELNRTSYKIITEHDVISLIERNIK